MLKIASCNLTSTKHIKSHLEFTYHAPTSEKRMVNTCTSLICYSDECLATVFTRLYAACSYYLFRHAILWLLSIIIIISYNCYLRTAIIAICEQLYYSRALFISIQLHTTTGNVHAPSEALCLHAVGEEVLGSTSSCNSPEVIFGA